MKTLAQDADFYRTMADAVTGVAAAGDAVVLERWVESLSPYGSRMLVALLASRLASHERENERPES